MERSAVHIGDLVKYKGTMWRITEIADGDLILIENNFDVQVAPASLLRAVKCADKNCERCKSK